METERKSVCCGGSNLPAPAYDDVDILADGVAGASLPRSHGVAEFVAAKPFALVGRVLVGKSIMAGNDASQSVNWQVELWQTSWKSSPSVLQKRGTSPAPRETRARSEPTRAFSASLSPCRILHFPSTPLYILFPKKYGSFD